MGELQDTRDLSLTTPLGPDVLLIRSIRYSEQLSRPFHAELDLVSSNFAIDLGKLVGQQVTVCYNGGSAPRYFNGYISYVAQMDPQERLGKYTATMVPWLWFLTRTADCRIFQNKAVPDIIKQIFQEQGFSAVIDKLAGSYQPWEYCVQYRETDFNFVSRLMEHEGIYYFFTHENGKHSIVLADDPSSHQTYPGYAQLTYSGGHAETGKEHVHDWTVEQQLQPGAAALNDFDFKLPQKKLLSVSEVTRENAYSKSQVYDYPGDYIQPADGDEYAKVRIQELQAQYEVARASTEIVGVCTGYKFTLSDFPRADQNKEYLVTLASCQITSDQIDASGTGGEASVFTCHFTAIDSKQQFRAPRITPKPVVGGPQTAIVVGPAGEEIYVDEFARVKVQFHWDRLGKNNESSSCWIRVAQIWAGKKWGGIFIPRIGQEVIVDFLEGDPDYPIITGRVYNGDNKPPYDLPGGKTRSTVQSRSTKGGGPANFNEIRMEDAKGSEELYFHAEKDHTVTVENDKNESIGHDQTEKVGHDKTESVGNNETISIGNNRTESVVANETLSVGASRTRNVGQNETVTVALMRTHTVGVNEAITVGAAQEVTVGAAQTVSVGAVQAITVGADQSTNVGANQSTDVGASQTTNVAASRTISVGADQSSSIGGGRTASVTNDDALTVGKKLTISAGDEVTITTGDASISMKKDGTITITGKDITINGSGKINVQADGNITMKGQKILQN